MRPWRATVLACTALALAACNSTTPNCGACPGDYFDPNGVIASGDAVARVRVCIDGTCRTQTYSADDRASGRYGAVIGTYPPDRRRIATIEATTFDAAGKVVRVVTGRSIDLPAVKDSGRNSCACDGLKIAYDRVAERFVVTTQ